MLHVWVGRDGNLSEPRWYVLCQIITIQISPHQMPCTYQSGSSCVSCFFHLSRNFERSKFSPMRFAMPISHGHILRWFALVWLDFFLSLRRPIRSKLFRRTGLFRLVQAFTMHWIVQFKSPINDNLLIVHSFFSIRSLEECQPYGCNSTVAPYTHTPQYE